MVHIYIYMVHPKPEPNMKTISYEMDIYLYKEMPWIVLYTVYIYIYSFGNTALRTSQGNHAPHEMFGSTMRTSPC